MKIAITGHRPNKLGNDYDLVSPLILSIKKYIVNYIKGGVLHNELMGVTLTPTLITGMALGIDTLFAEIAIENNMPFIAAIPCKNQWSMWPNKSVERYNRILSNPLCTIVNVSDKPYDSVCMQNRNVYMVNNCDILIAVWDGTSGGTANCVKYAKSINKDIIYINPKQLVYESSTISTNT